MQGAAVMTYGVLRAEVDESLHAVGYFSKEHDNEAELDYVYTSEKVDGTYDEESLLKILEDSFMDSLGSASYEDLHSSELHATTRFYDDFIDTTIALDKTEGITFILDRGGSMSTL